MVSKINPKVSSFSPVHLFYVRLLGFADVAPLFLIAVCNSSPAITRNCNLKHFLRQPNTSSRFEHVDFQDAMAESADLKGARALEQLLQRTVNDASLATR